MKTTPFFWMVLSFCCFLGTAAAQERKLLLPLEKDIVYGEAGGQKLQMDLYYPSAKIPETPTACIVCIHGGAWRGGSRGDGALVALALAAKGFVCASISYRLFDPVKRKQNTWPAQLDDVQLAVRFLRKDPKRFGIDPGRIGAIGFSAGGHLAALLGTTDTRMDGPGAESKISSRVQCVVNVFGPVDLTADYTALKFGQGTVQDLVDDFMGRGQEKAVIQKYQRDSSPLLRIDSKTAPMLTIHGDKDPIVPVSGSRKMHAALAKAGRVSEYWEIAGEGHTISPLNLPTFADKTNAFFSKHLATPSAKP
jgi:acetyl esterase/lipase